MARKTSESQFATVINSTVTVAFARIGMPIIIALAGFFGSFILNDLRTSIHGMYAEVTGIHTVLNQAQIDLKVLSNDITHDDTIISDHENRLRILERTK